MCVCVCVCVCVFVCVCVCVMIELINDITFSDDFKIRLLIA